MLSFIKFNWNQSQTNHCLATDRIEKYVQATTLPQWTWFGRMTPLFSFYVLWHLLYRIDTEEPEMFSTEYAVVTDRFMGNIYYCWVFSLSLGDEAKHLITLHVVVYLDILWYCFLLPSYFYVMLLSFLICDIFQLDRPLVFILITVGLVGFVCFVAAIQWILLMFLALVADWFSCFGSMWSYDHIPLMLMPTYAHLCTPFMILSSFTV